MLLDLAAPRNLEYDNVLRPRFSSPASVVCDKLARHAAAATSPSLEFRATQRDALFRKTAKACNQSRIVVPTRRGVVCKANRKSHPIEGSDAKHGGNRVGQSNRVRELARRQLEAMVNQIVD